MAANRVILLRGDQHRWHEEAIANDASIKPGYLIQMRSDGKCEAHSTRGGKNARYFAKDDYIRGGNKDGTIQDGTTYYASGDLVLIHRAQPGDLINAKLQAGESVLKEDYAISFGNGKVCKAAAAFLANTVADSTTVTNTIAETTFSNGTVAVGANSLKVGDKIRIRGFVAFPSTNSTDTATVRVKFGGATILTIPATDVANDDVAYFDVTITVRTIGASGTMVAVSQYSIGVLGTATTKTATLNSTTLDTTVAGSVTVTVQWSVASTSNQAILRQLTVERVGAAVGSGGGSEVSGDIIGQFKEDVDLSLSVNDGFAALEIGF